MKRALGFMNKALPITYNTYIGGVSATIGTAALLATKLGISVGAISNFTVVGSDIKCKITGSYAIPASAFLNNTSITYYDDGDGLVTSIDSSEAFKLSTSLRWVKFKNATFCGATAFAFANIDYIYIPSCSNLGGTAGINDVFNPALNGCKIYVNPSLATNNAGNPDGDIQAVSNAVIRYVTNFTAPSSIANLTVGTIFNKSIQLNFTAPSSTNTIEFYECYANGVFKNIITGSGQYITGLSASTNYSIEVKPVDIFFNKSTSNTVSQSTNTTWGLQSTALVSYYKLDETSGVTANDTYGTENLTNTGITINQSGKLGNSYLSTVTAQKLEKTNVIPITNYFSLNCWIYRTSAPGTLGGIIQHGDYSTNNGFGLWIWSSGNLSYRINQTFLATDSATYAIALNTWKMVTMTYDGANIKMYIDSVLKITTAHTTNPYVSLKRKLFNQTNNNSNFFGRIDEVSVHNTALSQSDIDSIYNSGTGITL